MRNIFLEFVGAVEALVSGSWGTPSILNRLLSEAEEDLT